MSDAMNQPRSTEHSPFDGTTSRQAPDPTGPHEPTGTRNHRRPYGLVIDIDGRILLADTAEEIRDRRFSQVTAETFRAPVPIRAAAETGRLRLPRTAA
ncbi:hypothetical protein AB0H49_05580 [Nocardia sp. NPDC050713]|uniref:hypothetical protein n=1 Tax=Nocardia sp. NPDC050713 TaxID=3154511 RepID=UPI0033E39D17